MGSSQNSGVQNYRPGVDRPAKLIEEVSAEMEQERSQKSSQTRSKVTGSLRVASRLATRIGYSSAMSQNTFGNNMVADMENQNTQQSGVYVPDNLMEVRQNVDYMKQSGKKVKTLGYTDAQIGTMSDLDKQKVISSGFASNPNGANVQSFLAKAAAYNITEKIMPQASVVAPVIKKVKQLTPIKESTYMDENMYGPTYSDADYGLVTNDVDYLSPEADNTYSGPTQAPEPDLGMQPEAVSQPETGGIDRTAMLDELTANIKAPTPEPTLTYGGSYF
jgi:hypothetical protein